MIDIIALFIKNLNKITIIINMLVHLNFDINTIITRINLFLYFTIDIIYHNRFFYIITIKIWNTNTINFSEHHFFILIT